MAIHNDPYVLTLALFLRITSISVAGYDWLITMPVVWEMFFVGGNMRFKFSLSDVLFILIRYTSMIALVISNVGYFNQGFTAESCSKYYMIAPVLKVLQIMVSQVILGYRTYSISRRSPKVKWFLGAFGIVVVALEWFTNLRRRVPSQNPSNCTPGDDPKVLITWTFYLVAMCYDIVTLGMSTFFLWRSAPVKSKMSDLIRMMLLDGLGYWVALTATNVLNLILYRASDKYIQSSAASFGYTVVWIMSQKLLIHVREAAAKRSKAQVMVTQELSTARDVVDAMRGQFGPKDDLSRSLDPDIQVQIERAVTVEYDSSYVYQYRRETHRTPRLIWDSRGK